MGSYLNPGSAAFQGSLRSQIYIDKSGLIGKMNALLGTEQKYVCVSRPKTIWKVYGGKYAGVHIMTGRTAIPEVNF